MKKILIYAILFFIPAAYTRAQVKVTADLDYDFITGHFSTKNGNTVGMKRAKGFSPRKKHNTYLFTLKEGQGVTVNIVNMNPLKYYAELSGQRQTLTSAPPDITLIKVDDYVKLLKPPAVNAGEKKATEGEHPHGAPPPIDEDIVAAIKEKIACIVNGLKAAEMAGNAAKDIAQVFASFASYYKMVKDLDAFDVSTLPGTMRSMVADRLQLVRTTNSSIINTSFAVATDVNQDNMDAIKQSLLSAVQKAVDDIRACYDRLYDLALQNAPELKNVLAFYKARPVTDEKEIMLASLPDTKKEFLKLLDWAASIKETIKEKIWPDVDKAIVSYLQLFNLSSVINAGTFMVDEDVMDLTLTIKKTADNKELKKIDHIKIYTTGGIRVNYGAGFYLCGLDNDEFAIRKAEKIEKVATLTANNTIDSVLQNVSYSAINKTSKRNISWGAMTFLQGHTNWSDGINLGAYFGLGLLLNDEARPIASAGLSVSLGRLSKMVNLHAGVVFGKADRLNPKYTPGTEYKGELTEVTVKEMHSSFLFGVTWNIGKIGNK